MTQGFDRNLQVLTASAFRDASQRAMALNLAEPIARLLLRLFLGSAVELQAERSGLVAIPEELRQFAGLQDELVLVGQGDYFEIWAPELWGKQEAQLRDADANSSRFAALPMATH